MEMITAEELDKKFDNDEMIVAQQLGIFAKR